MACRFTCQVCFHREPHGFKKLIPGVVFLASPGASRETGDSPCARSWVAVGGSSRRLVSKWATAASALLAYGGQRLAFPREERGAVCVLRTPRGGLPCSPAVQRAPLPAEFAV